MPQILQGDKMSNLATKPKFALAALIGLIAGVVSVFFYDKVNHYYNL